VNRNHERKSVTRKAASALRCLNGTECVAYPTLGQPAKLSRSNSGPTCFACEERRVASEQKVIVAKEEVIERGKANEPRWGQSNGLEEHVGREPAEVGHAREVRERRRNSVLTCERGLRSALASGDERLVRRWSRSLREAEARLAWAEADLARAEARARLEQAR